MSNDKLRKAIGRDLPPLPQCTYLVSEEAKRHGMHPAYHCLQNVMKYGGEGTFEMVFTAEQFRAWAVDAIVADRARAALSEPTQPASEPALLNDEVFDDFMESETRPFHHTDSMYKVAHATWLHARALATPIKPASEPGGDARAWNQLYCAATEVFTRIGAEGQVDRGDNAVCWLGDVLDDLDGGTHNPDLSPAAPASEPRKLERVGDER